MLAKYISENRIEKFNNIYIENGMVYTNAIAEEKALATGEWLPYIVDEMPSYDLETQYLTPKYEVINGEIHKAWVINDMSLAEEEAVD